MGFARPLIQYNSYCNPSRVACAMSEAVVAAVARVLFSELHICSLETFTATIEFDAAAVIDALQSDACRAAADAATALPVPAPSADLMAMTLQVQLMRDELRSVEQDLAVLRMPATPRTIQRAAVAESWQRRADLPSLRAAAAADRKAAAREKKAAAVERAEAAAVCEAAAAQKHAAEELMESAKAKLAVAAQKLCDARELRESVNAGLEKAAAEAAAVAAARAEKERERATTIQLQSEFASVTAAAAAAEEERAKAERQIGRVKEQMEGLKCVESILRTELWREENEHAEQCEAWERERSVGCALCHPLVLRARARVAGSRVPTASSTG